MTPLSHPASHATASLRARRLCVGLLAALVTPVLLATFPIPTLAQEADGEALLRKNCASCHAVGPADQSPMSKAPPFRDLYARLAPKELETVILQGAVSHYPGMPQIEFSLSDTEAIMAYLERMASEAKR